MGKLELKLAFLMGLLLFSRTIMAQRVSNVFAIQEGQRLRIKYELITTSTTEVVLYISENNGSTWSKVTQHLSGDVGSEVSGGSKEMVWDVLQARESLVGNSIVFKVKAGSEIKSVKIGNQVWMAENLSVDHYRNGDPIPTGLSNTQWESTTKGAFAIYNDDLVNDEIYGKLYNWYAVNDSRGLCPAGWHVPSDSEWSNLVTAAKSKDYHAGGELKSTVLWETPNVGATNNLGFNGLPGGYKGGNVTWNGLGKYGVWWSSSIYSSKEALGRQLGYLDRDVDRTYSNKSIGSSVRCVKDLNK